MPSRRTGSPALDEVDETIITLLQEDGRQSYGEIGRAVGLSEAAARQRVHRLRESGVLRIVAITDPLRLGRAVVATIGLRVSGDPRVGRDTTRAGARDRMGRDHRGLIRSARGARVRKRIRATDDHRRAGAINRRSPRNRSFHAPPHREKRLQLGSAARTFRSNPTAKRHNGPDGGAREPHRTESVTSKQQHSHEGLRELPTLPLPALTNHHRERRRDDPRGHLRTKPEAGSSLPVWSAAAARGCRPWRTLEELSRRSPGSHSGSCSPTDYVVLLAPIEPAIPGVSTREGISREFP